MNLSRHNKSRFPAWVALTVFAGILVFVLGTTTSVGSYARGHVISALSSVSSVTSFLRTATETENQTLRIENELLRSAALQHAAIAEENRELRELLSVSDHDRVITTAHVATRAGFSPYGTFTIAAGLRDGVREGALAVAAQNIAMGVVTDVREETATISLYSAPGTVMDARLTGGALISYKGSGNGAGEADVPRGLQVATTSAVFLPGTNYILGTVSTTTSSPEDPSVHLYIAPPIPFATIEYVSIVTPR